MLVYEEIGKWFSSRAEPYRKKAAILLSARANYALRTLITHKILRSRDAQCKTEESP